MSVTIYRESENGLRRQCWKFDVEWNRSPTPVFVVRSYDEQTRKAKRVTCKWISALAQGSTTFVRVDPPSDVVAEFREHLMKMPIYASYEDEQKERYGIARGRVVC